MSPATKYKTVGAGMIGNVLEWYDFAIYGYFAAAIGRQFFPHQDPVAQLLSAFGVFAVGYLMRPIGGALIGHIGDRFGRRAALIFSVVAMAIPTFLIGLLPGYATIGLAAPIALTLLRMVQGLSVGGEYTSSMVFLVEHAPEGRRGLVGALTSCGTHVGILLGSAVGAGFAATMSEAALEAWGWRIPFLLGLVVAIAGYVLRRHVQETLPAERSQRAPIVETLRAIVGEATRLGLEVRTIPRIHELFDNSIDDYKIRRIKLEDLLHRPALSGHVEGVEACRRPCRADHRRRRLDRLRAGPPDLRAPAEEARPARQGRRPALRHPA